MSRRLEPELGAALQFARHAGDLLRGTNDDRGHHVLAALTRSGQQAPRQPAESEQHNRAHRQRHDEIEAGDLGPEQVRQHGDRPEGVETAGHHAPVFLEPGREHALVTGIDDAQQEHPDDDDAQRFTQIRIGGQGFGVEPDDVAERHDREHHCSITDHQEGVIAAVPIHRLRYEVVIGGSWSGLRGVGGTDGPRLHPAGERFWGRHALLLLGVLLRGIHLLADQLNVTAERDVTPSLTQCLTRYLPVMRAEPARYLGTTVGYL